MAKPWRGTTPRWSANCGKRPTDRSLYCARKYSRIVSYSDDILILTRSQTAAKNVMKQAGRYLEEALKLTVNRDKTHIVHSKQGVDYLGVTIRTRTTSIQPKKIQAFKEKVKRMNRRNSACRQAHFALSNIYLEALGLFSLETFDVGISVPVT